MDEPEDKAIHEAGHAVVGVLIGLPVAKVNLDECLCKRSLIAWDRNKVRRMKICIASGGIAANLHVMTREPDYRPCCLQGWRDDILVRRRLARKIKPAVDVDQVIAEEQERAQQLVDNNWPAVERLAAAILDGHELNRQRIDEVIAAASPHLEQSPDRRPMRRRAKQL